MPQITLEDFQLSSDDESHEDEHSAEANSMHETIHDSGENEVADNSRDGDLYGRFSTDYEKFAWDDAQWSGIANVRKHQKKVKEAKKDKTEEQGKLETQSKPGELKKANQTT